ncbi:MAG: Bax inhibitor-1/YccA family protein [Bacteroidia bacterium]|nr:Bax inhibitor-1/YccA family protein [Bacteroidia bacterium]
MNSGNPFLKESRLRAIQESAVGSETMSFNGALNKTALLFLILLVGASWTWSDMSWTGAQGFSGKMLIGLLGGFVLALVTAFKPHLARYISPVYAFLQGMFLGGLSSIFEGMYPGIVIPAIVLTFGIMVGMLVTYRSGLIRVTEKFRIGVISATMGIALFYLIAMGLGFFGISIPFLFEGGMFGILFSLFVIVIAALNLVLDFDMIEQLSAAGMPKHMEWYGAFALMVTLVWLYIEILRLLAKTRE